MNGRVSRESQTSDPTDERVLRRLRPTYALGGLEYGWP